MAIIVKEPQKKAQLLQKMIFGGERQEDFLQTDVAGNPEIIPLEEVKKNIRLLIVGREFDSIDILGIDQDGEIYIFETKLYKNPTKRDVVAQALDYGASLWGRYGNGARDAFDEFWAKVEQKIRARYGVGLEEKLRELVSTTHEGPRTEDVTKEIGDLKTKVERNLREGEFTFLVLMDELTDQIRNHIDYLNEKSEFWVLGVELEYYQYGDTQIVVPTIYGNESTEKRSQARSRASGTAWDENTFFASMKGLGDEKARVVRDLYEFTKANSSDPWRGQPSVYPRFSYFVKDSCVFRVLNKGENKVVVTLCWLQRPERRKAWEDTGLDMLDGRTEIEYDLFDEIVAMVGLERFKKVAEEVATGAPRTS